MNPIKFLNGSGITHELESIIKEARKQLILVSPFIKFSPKLRDLLQLKSNTEITIIYGKKSLPQTEVDWIKTQPNIELRFCKNLHAKCYMNEKACIISSMNLYEFSQQNNYEMGVLVVRKENKKLFKDTLREIRVIYETSEIKSNPNVEIPDSSKLQKMTSSKVAKSKKMTTDAFLVAMIAKGFLINQNDELELTALGIQIGAEAKKGRFGRYFLWPETLTAEL